MSREKISFRSKSISTPNSKSSSAAASPSLSVSKHSGRSAVNPTLSPRNPSTSTSTPTQASSVLSDTLPTRIISSSCATSDSPSSSAKYSVDQLLRERDALIDKVAELTTQLERQNAVQSSAPPPSSISIAAPVTYRVAIFSDSMCRGIADIMRAQLPNIRVTSDIKPGAPFSQVVEPILSQCNDFGPYDFIFIQGGTNDMDSLPPNSAKRLTLPKSFFNLANKTNIILCSIPYRYDSLAYLSTNIYETNNFFKYVCSKSDFQFFDTNSFMFQPMYTKEGVHYNRRGKITLATKFINCIHSHLSRCNFVGVPTFNTYHVSPTMTDVRVPRVQVRSASTQTSQIPIPTYDVNDESTFGSFFHDTVTDLIDLCSANDDLLNNSFPIPVVPSHRQTSNFSPGDRTLVT